MIRDPGEKQRGQLAAFFILSFRDGAYAPDPESRGELRSSRNVALDSGFAGYARAPE
jgi:hypothetical protein